MVSVQEPASPSRFGRALRVLVFTLAALVSGASFAASTAQAEQPGAAEPAPTSSVGGDGDCGPGTLCPLDDLDVEPAAPTPEAARVTLLFFWGVGCPHCEEAKPFVKKLERERPRLGVESIEVKQDRAGRKRFIDTMRRLGAQAVGVPTFVVGEKYVVGFSKGVTEEQVTRLVDAALGNERSALEAPLENAVVLPWIGVVDPAAMSLPAFTLTMGLIDGINPCAMWVLLVLLGILAHVRSTRRLLMVGATFVVMSGIVYFVFMTAWLSLFQLVGLSRPITIGLGVLVLGMGLVNLKELIWFKQGISLTIPDKVKPKLYKKMRGVASAVSVPAAFVGIAALAFFVNLIELACTLGLPAIYTRVLSLRDQLSSVERYGYLVLYNLAYIVPLALIVIVYAVTLHRMVLGERGAKMLKGVSGVLLVVFGLLFILVPDVLA